MAKCSSLNQGIDRVNLINIPKELQTYRQWIPWKAVPKADSKPIKVPVNPHTGGNASTAEPSTWGSFDDAMMYYVQHIKDGITGMGFVFSKDDPFCGIDLDDCRDPETGELEDWAIEIINSLHSYSEVSPSKTGIKIFCRGSLPGSGRNFGNIEMYDTGRYFTLTGEIYDECPKTVEERADQVNDLYNRLVSEKEDKPSKVQKVEVIDNSCAVDIDSLPITWGTKKLIEEGEAKGKRSQAVMSVVNALVGAGLSDLQIFDVFDNYPIGEKYLEKGATKTEWLLKHVEKAKTYTGTAGNTDSEEKNETSLLFPHEIMSGAAGAFAEVYGSHLETPKEFLFMSYLTCLGTVLSRRLTLESEISPQPRLYTLLLGQSADERKSTSLNKTLGHFKEALDRFDVCRGVGSAEGLQKRLEDSKEGLLLCLDEFKQFVSKCKIDSSVLLPCVNTLYESNYYESQTKKSSIDLNEAYLSMLAASTVETYDRTWDASFTDIGFNNRLFLVPGTAERKHAFPSKVSSRDKDYLINKLRDVVRFVGGYKELEIDPSAKSLYESWYMDIGSSIHAKRIDTYALRLMSLLAVNDLKDHVDADNVRNVIRLCDWQLEVRKLNDPIDADNKIAKMEEKIRRKLGQGSRNERTLMQLVNAHRAGLWQFNAAKKNLEQAGEISLVKKSNEWVLN